MFVDGDDKKGGWWDVCQTGGQLKQNSFPLDLAAQMDPVTTFDDLLDLEIRRFDTSTQHTLLYHIYEEKESSLLHLLKSAIF